jgi:hypothetical protein
MAGETAKGTDDAMELLDMLAAPMSRLVMLGKSCLFVNKRSKSSFADLIATITGFAGEQIPPETGADAIPNESRATIADINAN